MSDQEKKNIEQVVEEAETSDAAMDESASAVEPPEPHVAVTPAASAQVPAGSDVAPRKASSAVAWLALLLVLALAGGAAWSVLELQRREAALVDRVSGLETTAGQKDSGLDELDQRLQRELKAGLGKLEAELEGESTRQAQSLQSLQSLEAQFAEQRAELARYSANDRATWLLAEAEYLLRLANQRLIMAGDTESAQALLTSADKVLRELDEVGLHEVRRAVAAELAAVRAVTKSRRGRHISTPGCIG